MNINLKKIILLWTVLSSSSPLFSQEKYTVSLKNDTVYNNGKVQFICQAKSNDKASIYSLRSLDNKLQGLLIFRFESDTIKFSGTFPYLEVRYSCYYPKIEILTLLDSYIRNKVFVNDKPSIEGLEAYCKARDLKLDHQIEHSSKTPTASRDSLLVARAKQDAMNQVKFTIHNNAAKPVKVFIGDKPKGGTGRVQIIPPHGNLNEHARLTEKIFLINDNNEEIKSIPTTNTLQRVIINASANGFE